MLTRAERTLRWGGAAGLLCAVAVAFFWSPESLPLPPCLFRQFTGLSCLTCGLTRSLHAATRGGIGEAVGFHLMGPLILLGAVAGAGLLATEAVRGESIRVPFSPVARRWVVVTVVCVWLGYWFIRLAGEIA